MMRSNRTTRIFWPRLSADVLADARLAVIMKRNLGRVRAAALLLAWGACAHADIFEVNVNDGSFLPNDLTIVAGDTVTFSNLVSSGTHNVTSDTGAFPTSPTSAQFHHDVFFGEVGEYLYHCGVHSAPGQDLNMFENGRIVVQAAEAAFLINAGLNDAWYNPDTPGQGFFFNVFPNLGMLASFGLTRVALY